MIRHHVRSFGNNKIMAIKLVRELTHCGLKEAKDLVEAYGSFVVVADAQTQARLSKEAKQWGIEFDPPLDGSTFTLSGSTASPERGGYSVRYVSGTRHINSIKLVRELTGLGLKESMQLVEQGGLVRAELTQTEAEEIARRFLEIEAHVEVLEPNASSSAPPRHDFQNEDDYDF
jgi:large subunit ribosomal protein L7/L12